MWAAGGQGGVRGDDDVEPSVPSPWAEALMHLHAVWLPALFAPLRRIGMSGGDLSVATEALTSMDQGLQNRPVRSNRRPPVAVYRTGLTGNRWKPVEFKSKFKSTCVTGFDRFTGPV